MTTAQQMYNINLDQIGALIKATGHKRTTLVQGHMGTGKSSLLSTLAKELPTHTACYFDCTTKDLGDISIPNLARLDAASAGTKYTIERHGVEHAPSGDDCTTLMRLPTAWHCDANPVRNWWTDDPAFHCSRTCQQRGLRLRCMLVRPPGIWPGVAPAPTWSP